MNIETILLNLNNNLNQMKKAIVLLLFVFTLCSCDRVAPNYVGVLMENYGKNGKSDYTLQRGRVNTNIPGTELFQVPMWEQRAQFDSVMHLKAADNTAFFALPKYSYEAISDSSISLVFNNSRLGSGDEFMVKLEYNVLEPKIYDIMKEESRSFITDTLMQVGGNLRFELLVQEKVKEVFKSKGLRLTMFSTNLDFTKGVKDKIDSRNESNTEVSLLDQQIITQRKRNEYAALVAEENKLLSSGLTDKILIDRFIKKWDGKSTLYGNTPLQILLKQQ